MSGQWDAIIVNYNGELFLDPCLRALTRMPVGPDRIIVVDNASTDESINELAGWPQADVIEAGRNLGYAGGANLGVGSSEAQIVVVMNPDVELDHDFGRSLQQLFQQDESLGCAGAKLVFPHSGLIQHAGGHVRWPELTTYHHGEQEVPGPQHAESENVDYVTGAALAIRRTAFDSMGGFDESYYPAYWEDVDLCYRMRESGWAVRYEPSLSGVHHEGGGQQRGDDYFRAWTRNRLRFAQRHLSRQQWWQEFIPAEISRLRGELSAIDSDAWLIRSGAATIDEFARRGGVPESPSEPVSRSEPLLDAITRIQELAPIADPAPPPLTPSDGVGRRVKRFLSRFSGRAYAEELYWQQRQFNESVVRAFEAQDRLNRELVAQLLYSLTVIGSHHYIDSQSTYQSTVQDESSSIT